MVSLRREVKSNDDVYGGYRVRFGANQNTYGFNPDNEDYDSRYPSNYGDSVAINQGRERFYPADRSNEKGARLSHKGKFLIALYIVIVALFIGLLIANSTTITSAKETVATKQTLTEQEKAYSAAAKDMAVTSESGEKFAMTQSAISGEVEVGEYAYLPEDGAVSYKKTSNLFNDICRKLG